MKGILTILSILLLTSNLISQVDTLFWQSGAIKEIREYYEYNEYNFKAYHSNGSFNFLGHVYLWKGSEYSLRVETAFDKDGTETVSKGNGTLYQYDSAMGIYSITNFRNKIRFSDYQQYYPNGNIKIKGHYGGFDGVLDKHKQGIWQFFKINAALLEEERKYVNGNEYYWNFWEGDKQTLKNGNGELKIYYDSGDLKAEGEVKDGKKWSLWTEYPPQNKNQTNLNYIALDQSYENALSFTLNLISALDTNNVEIGKNGNGYLLSYRKDRTLESKTFYVGNRIDSVFYYYENGSLFEKRSLVNHQIQTNEAFYPNKIRAFQQVNSDERKYWDWFGNLKKKIVNTWPQENNDSHIETTTFYYQNGRIKKISECVVTTTFVDSTGFIEDGYVCEIREWDENGKEINKP